MIKYNMTIVITVFVALFSLINITVVPRASGENRSVERKGPLKNLPSKEGAHIEKIKAMGDNSILKLGLPKSDPKWGDGVGRAWGSKMVFAADLRGAFLNGEGVHGGVSMRNGKKHYNDDLFFYDINQHRWVCVYPGMEIGKYSETIKGVNKDGFEVDQEGHPRPIAYMVHSYGAHTYDSDSKMYLSMWNPAGGRYWINHMPKRTATLANNKQDIINGIGYRYQPDMKRSINKSSPWMYDTVNGHWDRKKTEMITPRAAGHGSHLMYIPYLKKVFFFGGDVSFYDPKDNVWGKAVKISGPIPPRSVDAASCYDAKRKRIYIAMGSYNIWDSHKFEKEVTRNHVWALDLEKKLWINLKATGDLPPLPVRPAGVNVSQMLYDTVNDVLLYFAFGKGVYAYSPDKNEWTLMPGTQEVFTHRKCHHIFYDPKLNACFVFAAGDSGAGGNITVYRYKNILN